MIKIPVKLNSASYLVPLLVTSETTKFSELTGISNNIDDYLFTGINSIYRIKKRYIKDNLQGVKLEPFDSDNLEVVIDYYYIDTEIKLNSYVAIAKTNQINEYTFLSGASRQEGGFYYDIRDTVHDCVRLLHRARTGKI